MEDAAPLASPELHFNREIHSFDPPMMLWHQESLQRALPVVQSAGWPVRGAEITTETFPDSLSLRSLHVEDDGGFCALLEADRSLAYAVVSKGFINLEVSALDRESASVVIDSFRVAIPQEQADDTRTEVPVTFWYSSSHGPGRQRRWLDVPQWDDIASNYAGQTRLALGRLMRERAPQGGQLIMWHGPPGGGKTYAIRALGWEWRKWAELHYVVDPEKFLGSDAGYLLELCLRGSDEETWRVIVLEDSGEMLAPDAKVQIGQALSRLLNLSDGILGQGQKLLILVTTNEPLGRIHPGAARPGRCLSKIEFQPFTVDEAKKWLVDHGRSLEAETLGSRLSLADLFAMRDGRTADDGGQQVGFSAV